MGTIARDYVLVSEWKVSFRLALNALEIVGKLKDAQVGSMVTRLEILALHSDLHP